MTTVRSLIAAMLPVVLALILAGCGSAPAGTFGQTQAPGQTAAPTQPRETEPAAGEPTPGTALDACEVVTPQDVETAIELDAGTVGEGELVDASTVLDPAATECRYEGDWGGLVVSLTPTDGVNTFDAVESAFGEDAEALEMGDGALWFEDNDRGYFLKGAVMVRLQITFVADTELTSFRDPTVALGQAAIDKL
jgi:hypothetical protein